MIFNPEKHRRRSVRLRGYDYSQPGAYFVTICSWLRGFIFGTVEQNVGAGLAPALDIQENAINLTEAGKIVDRNWKNIPGEYQNINIDEYIIMPNHFHGIIRINLENSATERVAPTLGQIIGSFKSKCANDYLQYIQINHLNEIGKLWQRNYYEHVIRNEIELNKIREYIRDNPLRWAFDKDNPLNIQVDP